MTTTDEDEWVLDELLAEARELRAEPSADLMSRILADAEAVAAEPRTAAPVPPPTSVRWRGWLLALGGWPVVGGLVASTVAGLWIGAARPEGVSEFVPVLRGELVSIGFGLDEDPLSLLEG